MTDATGAAAAAAAAAGGWARERLAVWTSLPETLVLAVGLVTVLTLGHLFWGAVRGVFQQLLCHVLLATYLFYWLEFRASPAARALLWEDLARLWTWLAPTRASP
jgi:hypothetical protein